MFSFLAELRRRRVVQVAIVYAVVGWLTFQVAQAVVPELLLPPVVTRVVLVLILLGLPLALVLAWAYDITPDGVRRTEPVRWEQVNAIVGRALETPPAERAGLVLRDTHGDAALRREVESLLAAHDRQGPLDRPLAGWVEPAAASDGFAGRTVGRYRVLERLGGGGMGIVYSARDDRLDRVVALKFLPPHLSLRADAKQRFLIEAQAAAALDHPNICTVHEIGETADGQLFIAMPLYDGETLRQHIARGPLPVLEAVELAVQAARGMAKAHDRGIVHRDIKPANLIVTADGVLKILDFGIAKLMDVTVTGSGGAQGTVAYMSPEQARGEAVDGRSDVWSLGVVLFEMLTGQRPFRGATDSLVLDAIAAAPLPPLRLEPGGDEDALERILHRMLAREPGDRFAHATELIRELERYHAARARIAATPVDNGAGAALTGEATETPLPREGERRPATVVVATVSGYAGLIERLLPEQLASLSGRMRADAEEIAVRHGGVLNEFREDEMVMLFGVSVAHEDHGVRAVRAALELHDRVRSLREVRRGGNPDIRLHTGIDSGPLVARPAPAGGVRFFTAGDALGLARRLAAHAAADEVWISPECHRVVGPFFDTEARPRVDVPHQAGGLAPRRVVRHTGIRSRLDAALRTGLTPFIGREAELARLGAALRSARAGTGQLVVIRGEAGLGKSRLLHEFRTRGLGDDIRLLTGRCQSHGAGTAYLPFAEVLRACFGLGEGDAGDSAPARVAERTAAIAPELAAFVPLYLHLLGTASPEHPIPRHLHGDQLRLAIQEAVAGLLALTARDRPLVLLLEDWHWADDASQSVLEQLMEVGANEPLLALVTSRTTLDWRGPGRCDVLALEPLGPDASAAMLAAMAGADTFPAPIAQLLHARTGGNPFFLEEICHALLEDGTLQVEAGTARLTGPLDALQLPDTVQAVIHTRLERLERESRELVRLAAVIGREFSRPILERAMPSAGRLPNALQALKSAGLIHQVRVVPDAVFRFRHTLTQEVAYNSLLEHQRRELHARVATAIEAVHHGRLGDQLQQLAHHHSRAEHWKEAIDYGVRAADRLLGLSEFTEALQQLERCEDWLGRSPIEDRVPLEVDILLRQERLCETLGLRARQQDLIDGLIQRLEPSGDRARLAEVYLRQGDLFTTLRRFDLAETALENSLAIRRALGDRGGERNTLRSLGLLHWHQGRHDDALRSIDAALALDRDQHDPAGTVGDLVGRGVVLKAKGELGAARRVLEEALDLSQRELAADAELPGGFKLPYILHNLANVYREMGDDDAALALLRDALAATEAKHMPVQGSYHRTTIAHILLQQGKVEESVDTYRAAVASARRARYSPGLSQALSALGEVLLGLGRPEEALPHLAEATDLFTQLRDDTAAARTWSLRGGAHERMREPDRALDCWSRAREICLRAGNPEGERRALAAEARVRNALGVRAFCAGDLEAALREYRAALELFRTLDDAHGVGLALNSLAVTLIRQRRHDEAEALLVEALAVHRAAGNATFEAHAETAMGEVAEARGDGAGARAHYETSLALREAGGDRAGAGWTLVRLARLAARNGQPEQAAPLLERAHRIAGDCGDAELLAACSTEIPGTAPEPDTRGGSLCRGSSSSATPEP